MENTLQTNVLMFLITISGANGKKYNSDYRAILNWVVDRVKQDSAKKQNINNGINDFKELMEEAKYEQSRNNKDNNIFSG